LGNVQKNGTTVALAVVVVLVFALGWSSCGERRTPKPPAGVQPVYDPATVASSNCASFNEPASEAPDRDFTMTIVPSADLWLPAGRTWLYGVVREEVSGSRSSSASDR